MPQAQSQNHTADPTVLAQAAAGASLVPAGFSVSDGPDGTLLRIGVGAAGELAVSVSRVPVPGVGEPDGPGYVTAPWRRPDGTITRGVFPTATLR